MILPPSVFAGAPVRPACAGRDAYGGTVPGPTGPAWPRRPGPLSGRKTGADAPARPRRAPSPGRFPAGPPRWCYSPDC